MVTFCYQRRILGIILKSQPWQPDEAVLSGLPHSGPTVVLNVVFGLIWKILFEDHQLYGRLVRRWHWICLWRGAWAFCMASREPGEGHWQWAGRRFWELLEHATWNTHAVIFGYWETQTPFPKSGKHSPTSQVYQDVLDLFVYSRLPFLIIARGREPSAGHEKSALAKWRSDIPW